MRVRIKFESFTSERHSYDTKEVQRTFVHTPALSETHVDTPWVIVRIGDIFVLKVQIGETHNPPIYERHYCSGQILHTYTSVGVAVLPLGF